MTLGARVRLDKPGAWWHGLEGTVVRELTHSDPAKDARLPRLFDVAVTFRGERRWPTVGEGGMEVVRP